MKCPMCKSTPVSLVPVIGIDLGARMNIKFHPGTVHGFPRNSGIVQIQWCIPSGINGFE